MESVQNLRNSLEAIGSGLLVCHEKPEDFIPKLVSKGLTNTLLYQEEVCSEELKVESSLTKRLKNLKCGAQTRWGSTIYHYEDLNIPPEDSASIYGNFARKSEGSHIRQLCLPPKQGDLPLPQDIP